MHSAKACRKSKFPKNLFRLINIDLSPLETTNSLNADAKNTNKTLNSSLSNLSSFFNNYLQLAKDLRQKKSSF